MGQPPARASLVSRPPGIVARTTPQDPRRNPAGGGPCSAWSGRWNFVADAAGSCELLCDFSD